MAFIPWVVLIVRLVGGVYAVDSFEVHAFSGYGGGGALNLVRNPHRLF
jgi:hypothetical protein